MFGHELDLLRLISESSLASVVSTPPVRHVGEPHEVFPHRWGVLDGFDAWSARGTLQGELDQWLDDPEWRASELIDVAAVKRLSAEAVECRTSRSFPDSCTEISSREIC
jgi:hypothetical protein